VLSNTEARELKKNSLKEAKEADIFGEDILRKLKNVEIKVKSKNQLNEIDQRILFGYVVFNEENEKHPEIVIQDRNLATSLPNPITKILNQSAMDHEIIGHIGHYFLENNGYSEEAACNAQFRMARHRTSESKIWYIIAVSIPLFQKFHRGVSLKSYFNS